MKNQTLIIWSKINKISTHSNLWIFLYFSFLVLAWICCIPFFGTTCSLIVCFNATFWVISCLRFHENYYFPAIFRVFSFLHLTLCQRLHSLTCLFDQFSHANILSHSVVCIFLIQWSVSFSFSGLYLSHSVVYILLIDSIFTWFLNEFDLELVCYKNVYCSAIFGFFVMLNPCYWLSLKFAF